MSPASNSRLLLQPLAVRTSEWAREPDGNESGNAGEARRTGRGQDQPRVRRTRTRGRGQVAPTPAARNRDCTRDKHKHGTEPYQQLHLRLKSRAKNDQAVDEDSQPGTVPRERGSLGLKARVSRTHWDSSNAAITVDTIIVQTVNQKSAALCGSGCV